MNSQSSQRTLKWIPILLIALAAIFLRVYAIDRLPPGLFGDEAVEGLDALDVLAGNFAIWFHAHLGREPLYVYLVALSYWAFGITPLATRLPAIIAGLLTVPATFFFVREWARNTRVALLTTALLAVSFWHIQMTRDAHRDTLLPLVEAIGYWLLWRAIRTRSWKAYAGAGAVLGLAIYTYSPGRFVSVFIVLFFAVEFVVARLTDERRAGDASTIAQQGSAGAREKSPLLLCTPAPQHKVGLGAAALAAVLVMLPLGAYFAQNPIQFSRRFESVSVLDADSPTYALAESVAGNLAQYVVPGAGYQSKHYNLPGKPIFDLFIAPWFLLGLAIAIARWRQAPYRFLLLWFAVMMLPAFLTADMIPKGVRALGVVPGIFMFPALAMDWVLERAESVTLNGVKGLARADGILTCPGGRCQGRSTQNDNRFRHRIVVGLIVLSLIGSAIWTAFDYFIAWANRPELPLAFDADMVEVSDFLLRQPTDQTIYISSLVYRPPTQMLLGRHVATTRYVDPATRIKEFDATSALVAGLRDSNPIYVWVGEQTPPEEWLARLAPQATPVGRGKYYSTVRLGTLAPPRHALDVSFNPLLKLIGYSRYTDEAGGIALYWRVDQLPSDRQDIQAALSLADVRGALVTQGKHKFGVPPLEWAIGDTIVEWYALEMPTSAAQFSIQLTRSAVQWQSPVLTFK